jgi:DNA polymerase I-like protein with 3'-5' exonuclease and polymerase domains
VPHRPDPASVPVTVVGSDEGLPELSAALDGAAEAAADTETPVVGEGVGALRVVSVAVTDRHGERAFVVDARDVTAAALGRTLAGRCFDAWNAGFDARVLAEALGASLDPQPTWWDGQLADALLHQGQSGFGFYHGLAWATERYLGLASAGKGTTQLSFDSDSDLSATQIAYAAADAVETMWVSRRLRRELVTAGLTEVADLEMSARPFLERMERNGIPVDWPAWRAELEGIDAASRAALTRMAELTGGGQASLFSSDLEPSWNPLSERDLREQLNQRHPDRVRAWSRRVLGTERLLLPTDPIRQDVLVEIGGELAESVLTYRDAAKVLSTYGESLQQWADGDGRMHPEYLQVVGTNTGRLASRNPNAQNLTPRLKPFVRPGPGLVLAYADLSQAELGYLAQVTGDESLRDAFATGRDVHVATAGQMFGVDMEELARSDPSRWARLRAQAKTINFGIVYGQRGRALARSLSLSGVETTEEEGRRLLESWLESHPRVAAWAAERDDVIERLAADPGAVDWDATLELHRLHRAVTEVRIGYRRRHRRWPDPAEVAEEVDGLDVPTAAWVMSHHDAVVLRPDGARLGFESRTLAGRRQQFDVRTERVLLAAAVTAARAEGTTASTVRTAMTERTGMPFLEAGQVRSAEALEKLFEDRRVRRGYVEELGRVGGHHLLVELLDRALSDRIRALANAYRNAPIQGGVADAMLAAFAVLQGALPDEAGIRPVQTVHDSVVAECEQTRGLEVAAILKEALEEGMRRFCPDVAARATADVRTSLADSDVIASVG